MEYKEGDVVEVVTKLNKLFGRGELVKLIATTDEGGSWVADDNLYRGVVHKSEIAPYEYEEPKENQELPMTTPEQYSKLKIDTIELSKANDTPEEQLAICRFMIDKYNRRQKNQDAQDIEKLIHYAYWKKEIINSM